MQKLYSFRQSALSTLLWFLPWAALSAEYSMNTLYTFEDPPSEPGWFAQNDGVMGGISTGQPTLSEGRLVFSGSISLENNGGFAQIYSPQQAPTDFSEYTAIRLRIKGDGRRYQFRLATDAHYRGSAVAYRAEFETKANEWMDVSLPFDAFQPGFRGRLLPGPPFNPSTIQSIGFLLNDGRPGDFLLIVDWIGLAWSGEKQPCSQ